MWLPPIRRNFQARWRLLRILFTAILGAALLPTRAVVPADDSANSPEVEQALTQGDAQYAQKHLQRALDSYRSADKLSHHSCATCLLRMVRVERLLGEMYQALDDAKKAVAVAGYDKVLANEARVLRGSLLAQMASKPNDKKLRESEEEFRAALAADPAQTNLRYNLGIILLREERDAEGIAVLDDYIKAAGADPALVQKARAVIAEPQRARTPVAPDFSMKTLGGGQVSNETLRGSVVLIDFWATWCPPCRESIPLLKTLQKRFAGRGFGIVGVSSDTDQDIWKCFIDEHHMDWPEYIDLSGVVLEAFEVHQYPTFVVVDREGVVRYRHAGVGMYTSSELDSAINKALKKPATPQQAGSLSAAETPGQAGPN